VSDKIEVNGVEYVRAGCVQQVDPVGNRHVVVVDRGWIFAGDLEEVGNRLKLSRAVWVFHWKSIGFNGVIEDPKSSKVEIRPMNNIIDIPMASEVYRIKVEETWGL